MYSKKMQELIKEAVGKDRQHRNALHLEAIALGMLEMVRVIEKEESDGKKDSGE